MFNITYIHIYIYFRKMNEQSEIDKYLSKFSLFLFLLEYPDPITYFNNSSRNHAFSNFEEEKNDKEQEFALTCLFNQFPFVRETNIKKVFQICKRDIIKSYNKLKKIGRNFKIPRDTIALPDISINKMMLLHEVNILI